MPAMLDPLPSFTAEIVPACNFGKVNQLTGIPHALAYSSFHGEVDFILDVKAETGGAGGIAGSAAVTAGGDFEPDGIMPSRLQGVSQFGHGAVDFCGYLACFIR